MNTEYATYQNGLKFRHRVETYAMQGSSILAISKGARSLPEMPGGGLDAGESIEVAGLRELMEEAGWAGTNPRQVEMDGSWVCDVTNDLWLAEAGWSREVQYAVACEVTGFAPTAQYGSENDHLTFTLLPAEKVFDETHAFLFHTANTPRKILQAQFRLRVLEILFPELVRPHVFKQW
jgi:8-oxo-dGTP pyrophosphatase MutT (NUDIX family)